MFCTECGAELSENANFCSKCGARTGKGKAANVALPSKEWKDYLAEIGDELNRAFAVAGEEIEKAFTRVIEELRKVFS